jgi:hypothetical protein
MEGIEVTKNKDTYKQVTVLGFNSTRFDINFILSNLCNGDWQITSVIGAAYHISRLYY